mgnify:CR=1 FL=1
MEARAVKLLASDDPMDLSAGAWFAGFHPEWNLQESILPLVGHSRWEVRRSAVEAVGRLRYGPAAPKLADMVEDDPDDHVRADALRALAAGQHDYRALEARGWAQLTDAGFDPDYFDIRDARLAPPTEQTPVFRVLAAGRLGRTRLIDNKGVAAPR